jgi:hypothetical protein
MVVEILTVVVELQILNVAVEPTLASSRLWNWMVDGRVGHNVVVAD